MSFVVSESHLAKEGGLGLIGEGAWLVADLPAHYGGVVYVLLARVAVGAADDEAHVVVEELMGRVVGRELAGE